LSLGFELSISVLALPLSAIGVDVKPCAVHFVVLPFAFIHCAIGELVDTFTVMLVVFPLSSVKGPTCVMIHPIAVHLVLNPRAFVPFLTEPVGRITRDFQDSLPVFHLDCIEKSPITFVHGAIDILELAKTMKLMFRDLGLLLFGRLFDDFLFGLFLRAHAFYNLSLCFKFISSINVFIDEM
jgi:hypothetical protein